MLPAHKYSVGQTVDFIAGRLDINIPRGAYTIVRLLPSESRDCQYRVKNARDGHERVLRESQLANGASLS
jgi:hypothetical protein